MKVNGTTDLYSQLASGSRVNSAANDPAALAISEKLTSQIKGDSQGAKNIESSQDLLNTADGALNSIQDSLGRIRELSVQASNGIYTAEDRQHIQSEISGLLEEIKSTALNTEFNTQKLLDGSFTDKNLGTGANGQGTVMSLQNTSLEALGIEGFSVEGDFSIEDIDNAIGKVSEARSEIGASVNGLQANLNNTRVSEYNQTSANSTLADLDIAKAIMELNKEQALDQYKIALQDKKQETEQGKLDIFL